MCTNIKFPNIVIFKCNSVGTEGVTNSKDYFLRTKRSWAIEAVFERHCKQGTLIGCTTAADSVCVVFPWGKCKNWRDLLWTVTRLWCSRSSGHITCRPTIEHPGLNWLPVQQWTASNGSLMKSWRSSVISVIYPSLMEPSYDAVHDVTCRWVYYQILHLSVYRQTLLHVSAII